MLAVGVVFLVEYLDDTVKTDEDVQRQLTLPTLGNIGRITPVKEPGDHLIALNHPRSPISEAYRVLRSNTRFAKIDNPSASLLVTSPGPEEGKTTTAANLAVVLAQAGQKVILVDSDLRRPTLHEFFGLDNHVGLTDLLVDGEDLWNQALRTTDQEGLRILTSGRLPPNPSELLGSDAMRSTLRELEKTADVVVLDSPPLLAVADASILGSIVGGAILVVESGKTRNEAARRAKDTLDNSGVKLLGVVVNRISRHRGAYGYYHYYYSEDGRTRKRKGAHRDEL
jgi:capsular exopolysaccharide synthesis family protein